MIYQPPLLQAEWSECSNHGSYCLIVLQGGESTREEMCFTFPVYYPRADLSTCVSQPQLGAFVPFADQYIPNE